ncbi:DUF2868 domain-containing protein [Verrucomicrobiaceae bacterium 5K15]|uniref:DUF2868 domain-containing protein n=1 Tax=Oceaniferula flava TaxID=2800421 RepID=A0AAE2SBK5_9BACT|nr:DUF2868 domain-containing protein [Oceaniferula flavus]MBK1855155.1 DUF2868 domain-containing protein [Oceaniferula flavus]MBM1136461.1 DUF2868 domain-containing protein [Oceaniferula flavus]
MTRQQKKRSWTLRDLVDFEVQLEKAARWKSAWRNGVGEELENEGVSSELNRRRLGFRWMLEEVREAEHEESGHRLDSGARLLAFLLWLVMLLTGIGVLRGLLMEFEFSYSGGEVTRMRGYNIWILLGVTIGFQWLLMLGSVLAYWLWRRWSGSLSIFQVLLQKLIRKWGGEKMVGDVWKRLQTRVSGGQSVISWRLARILQAGGVGYNCGLLLGLFGCLWFFQIGFYWESTLPQFGRDSLIQVTEALAFFSDSIAPGAEVVDQAKRGSVLIPPAQNSMPERMAVDLSWGFFFLFAIAVWGLLPRVILWVLAWSMERRALAGMDFQESRHRSLWRDLTKVQRGEVQVGPADGVVLLDIGGLEMDTDSVRPFLLQTLRVNPEARFSLGTLDTEEEAEAMEKAKSVAMGVVFLVEGWNLSPKQMEVYHDQIRSAIGADHMIRYVVIGSEEELAQWAQFVDSLRDSETSVVRYDVVG